MGIPELKMPITIEVDCPFCGKEKLTWQKRKCSKTGKEISYTDLLALTVMDLMEIAHPPVELKLMDSLEETVDGVLEASEKAADAIAAVADTVENIAEVIVEKTEEAVEEIIEEVVDTAEEIKEALSLAKEPEPEPEPEVEPEPEPEPKLVLEEDLEQL